MDSAIDSKATLSQKKVRSDMSRVWEISLFALLAVSLLFVVVYYFVVVKTPRLVETEYQAVLLDNGSSYFGKIVHNTAD
jgi:ABC-type Fe3+ transport system permease subunit